MKILDAKIWKMEVECPTCHSKLEIEAADVRFWTSSDYGGGTDTGFDYTCPQCNDKPDLHERSLPKVVRDAAVDRHRIDQHRKEKPS